MRKILLMFLFVVCVFFIVPICFTISFKSENQLNEMTEAISENVKTEGSSSLEDFNYGKFNTIKLLHTKTNQVEEILLDDYLAQVVSAEMPVQYEVEALKAQAVVARTYTIYKILHGRKHENADICDSSLCCQAWISKDDRFDKWNQKGENCDENWNKIVSAVNDTKGKVITYNGEVINAFFHANSGGKTEMPINVWGGSGYPYLQVVETAGEEEYSQGKSEVVLGKDEFVSKMKGKYGDFQIDWGVSDCIKIVEYTESNRIRTIKIGNKNISGVEARSIFGLKSSNFSVEVLENEVKFLVLGYGHGVGLSQTGSNTLAASRYEL